MPRKAKESKSAPVSFVTFLLDRSGSMGSIKNQTIEGFNAYLGTLKADDSADIRFTFLQFDTGGLEKVAVARPVAEVPDLTHQTFLPRGGTPLIDAAYKTIKAVEAAIAKEEAPPRVVICIQTDGEENESKEYTWTNLSQLVKAKQEAGWQFNFMGAGIDAYAQACLMGISVASTVSYGKGLANTVSAMRSMGQNSMMYANGAVGSTAYSSMQKMAAGDTFDPALAAQVAEMQQMAAQKVPKNTGAHVGWGDVDLAAGK